MKTILLTLVLPLLITVGFAPQADAGGYYGGNRSYVSSRAHCGCPIYSQRYVAYYNRCGQPVYRVRNMPVRHSCRSRGIRHGRGGCNSGGHSYGHSYGHGSSYRSNSRGHSGIPTTPLPRISFSPGRSIHVGFGLR